MYAIKGSPINTSTCNILHNSYHAHTIIKHNYIVQYIAHIYFNNAKTVTLKCIPFVFNWY